MSHNPSPGPQRPGPPQGGPPWGGPPQADPRRSAPQTGWPPGQPRHPGPQGPRPGPGSRTPLVAGLVALVLAAGAGGAVVGKVTSSDTSTSSSAGGSASPAPRTGSTTDDQGGAVMGGPNLSDTDVAQILRTWDDRYAQILKRPTLALFDQLYTGVPARDGVRFVRAVTNGIKDNKPINRVAPVTTLNKGLYQTGQDAKGDFLAAYTWRGDTMNSSALYEIWRRDPGGTDWRVAFARSGVPPTDITAGRAPALPPDANAKAAKVLAASMQYVSTEQLPAGFSLVKGADTFMWTKPDPSGTLRYTCSPVADDQIVMGVKGKPGFVEITAHMPCTKTVTGKDLPYGTIDQRVFRVLGNFSTMECPGHVTLTARTDGTTAELVGASFNGSNVCTGTL